MNARWMDGWMDGDEMNEMNECMRADAREKKMVHTTPVVPGWSPTPVLDRPKRV